jgi:hypothetical protein
MTLRRSETTFPRFYISYSSKRMKARHESYMQDVYVLLITCRHAQFIRQVGSAAVRGIPSASFERVGYTLCFFEQMVYALARIAFASQREISI